MNIKEDLELFTNTKILSDISKRGYQVLINGAQLLYELNNDRSHKSFTGYTTASPTELQNIFANSVEYNVYSEQNTTLVSEVIKDTGTAYEFTFITRPVELEGDFCNNILNHQMFNIDKVGYEPSRGIIDLYNYFDNFSKGIYDVPDNIDEILNKDPSKLITVLNTIVNNQYLSLSEKGITAIKNNAYLIRQASVDSLRIMMESIVSHNGQKLELLKNLGVLQHLLPEFCMSFDDTDNFPDFLYPSSGDGCMAIIPNLNEISSWALVFYYSGKSVSEKTDFGNYRVAINFTENSMIIANKVLHFLGYNDSYIIKVLSLLFLLNDALPEDYWGAMTYIIDKFEDYSMYTNFIEIRYGLSQLYGNYYQQKESEKITFLAEVAENYEDCWNPESLQITKAELDKIVGENFAQEALKYLKSYLFKKPFDNNKEALIKALAESNQFLLNDNYVKVAHNSQQLSPDNITDVLIRKRYRVLNELSKYNYDKVEDIIYNRDGKTEEELNYARTYLYLKKELNKLNDELLARDALSLEEKDIVMQSKSFNDIYKKELDKIKFIESMFNDTDTEFFEYIYQLTQVIT